jgi:peptidyl-prolyl cis-trans isomerase SurA
MQFPNKLAAGIGIACAAALFSCSPKQSDIVVAKIGADPVPLSEYENLYLKSAGTREQAATATQEERERFLDLLTKFKLKLSDAYDQGLDQRADIKSEIAQYKGSLVASFLTEREVNGPGVKQMYEARRYEVRASHILLQLASNAEAEDSARVYKAAYEIIAALKAGAKFESLAVAQSTDPSAQQNKGDLYYFTGGQMVPEFEEAAFAMKVGEISTKPVRTQYGLHIIKVVDRRLAPGEVKASHIMIRFERQDPSPEDTLAAYAKIKLIQDSIKTGVDFAELAIRNSGDPGSAPRGGDLGWFSRRRWIQPFDEIAFTLKSGQVSDIVRTIYGYHLIKCYETKPPKTFEESKKDNQQAFQQTRFQPDYNKFLNRLKTQLQYSVDQNVLDKFAVAFDSTTTTRDSAWSATVPADIRKQALFKFGVRGVSVDSTLNIITSRPDMASMPLNPASVRENVGKIGEQLLFQVRGETIGKDYPEFASIMKDYTDGILLYQIEQERVWGKVAVNDTVLKEYFEKNRDKFMWPDRVDFTSASFLSDSIAQLVNARIQNGKSLEQIFATDSAYMKKPITFETSFAKGAARLSSEATRFATTIADDLLGDDKEKMKAMKGPQILPLRMQATIYRDTLSKKNMALATQRTMEMQRVMKSLGVGKRNVSIYEVDLAPLQTIPDSVENAPAKRKEARAEREKTLDKLRLEIIGKRSWFVGGIENKIEPVTTDERTYKADSLAVSVHSRPFNYKGNFTIVRLNKKDPLRRKTYDEAGTEVSSAFQEYESKRLEKVWLDGLRAKRPVVEYKEALKNAFAPAK